MSKQNETVEVGKATYGNWEAPVRIKSTRRGNSYVTWGSPRRLPGEDSPREEPFWSFHPDDLLDAPYFLQVLIRELVRTRQLTGELQDDLSCLGHALEEVFGVAGGQQPGRSATRKGYWLPAQAEQSLLHLLGSELWERQLKDYRCLPAGERAGHPFEHLVVVHNCVMGQAWTPLDHLERATLKEVEIGRQ